MVASAGDEIAEAQGRSWLANPLFADRLAAVRRWREANAQSPLLDVLGQVDDDVWSVGQDYALGQVLAGLRNGLVLLAEVALAEVGAPTPTREALRAALPPDGQVHSTVDEQLFLWFSRGRLAQVRQLWAPVPATRSLASPSTIPVLLGPASAADVLAQLRARTAVARWPAGHRTLSVLLTHPAGTALLMQYPPQPLAST